MHEALCAPRVRAPSTTNAISNLAPYAPRAPSTVPTEAPKFHGLSVDRGVRPTIAQGCQPRFAQGWQPRVAQGCLPCIAWGCLLLHIAWGCLLLRIAWGCLLLSIAAGSTVVGAPPRGSAGHEEGGGGLETTNPSSSFAAGDCGGGQETCAHCSTFAAGRTVAGAPPRGAADFEEGGRSGDHPPSSLSAARTAPAERVSLGAVSTSADRMASSSLATGNIATCGPLEASGSGPGLCAGLLSF
ncbi:UNVERIFIED_CONTAM: hypothetical protein FKN15_023899 [Acipenser sinensis]